MVFSDTHKSTSTDSIETTHRHVHLGKHVHQPKDTFFVQHGVLLSSHHI